MEAIVLYYTSLTLLLMIFLISKNLSRTKRHNLPPSPSPPLPIIGHLHLLKQPLHRTFQRVSLTHGPIFTIKLGFRRIVIVSSPHLVEECFTAENDIIFSNRPHVLVDKYIGYNHTTMAGAPYGHQWRCLRRLGAQEVLSTARLNMFAKIRENEMRRVLQTILMNIDHGKNMHEFQKVVLRPKLFEIIFNMIMMMIAGKRYSGGEKESEEFRQMVSEVFEYAQSSNPEDFLPFLLWVDYRGLKRKMADLGKRLDDFYEGLLEEHRREKRNNTMIGHLLSLQASEPEFYTDQIIKGFITNMIIAGTDTSVVTIEWAMSLLLNHPNVLQSAKQELDTQVGHKRLLEEPDLSNLPYLRNIISETFRLFPPGPMVVPRESSSGCKVGGYDVPGGTILLVNAWAIQRDPTVWDEPTSFKPERFEGKEVESQKLMPFGMGRRACPGSGLGQRMVRLVLGSLIQCFEWERVDLEEIDLTEGVGLTMPKLKPLETMCRPREIMIKALRDQLAVHCKSIGILD